MAKNKPTKPTNLMPRSFGGEKNNFSDDLIASGFEANVPETYNGDNLNYQLDSTGKELEYVENVVDYIVAMPSNNVLTVNSNNQLDYLDASTLAVDNNVVHKTGDETISGAKTFNDTIVGSVNGNANTATNDIDGNPIKTTYQKTANISQSIDESETQYPSNKAVKTAVEQVLPTQTNNAGKFLSTNGNSASWQNALSYNKITNCILEAPNGIVEFSNENKTVTLKQGLKLLIPNGRNADGSLKNFEYTLPEDSSVTFNYPSNNSYLTFNLDEGIIDEQHYYFEQSTEPNVSELPFVLWYNTTENKMYHKQAANTPFVEAKIVVVGKEWTKDSTGKTIVLESLLPVRLLNSGQYSFIAGLSMPSDYYDDLVAPQNNGYLIAPADGYYCLWSSSTSAIGYLAMYTGAIDDGYGAEIYRESDTTYQMPLILPVRAGQKVTFQYQIGISMLRFYYLQGWKGGKT